MRYRELSATGDMQFGSGQKNFLIDTPAAVAQVVETTLKLWLGEWYLNVNDGTPYPEGVIGIHPNLQTTADNTLINTINNCQGVVNVENFTSVIDPVTRKYTEVGGTLNTIYGQTQLQIQNMNNF